MIYYKFLEDVACSRIGQTRGEKAEIMEIRKERVNLSISNKMQLE
jgi:hypothetical protein